MDGSALERPIVVLWIAYVSGVPVTGVRQLVVGLTSALLSMGASPIPSAGVSTLFVMLEQASIPLTPDVLLAASFCLAVEWLLDSIRTAVNVNGDAVGAAIIDGLIHKTRGPKQPAGAAPACASAGVTRSDGLVLGGAKGNAEFAPPELHEACGHSDEGGSTFVIADLPVPGARIDGGRGEVKLERA